MIVPAVSASELWSAGSENPEKFLASLCQHLIDWGLLGKVILSDTDQLSLTELEQVSQAVGGRIDLWVDLSSTEGDVNTKGLACLNAGATAIIAGREGGTSEIPAQCCKHLVAETELAAVNPAPRLQTSNQPTLCRDHQYSPQQVAQREIAHVDVWIDSSRLQQEPQFIADYLVELLVSDRPDGMWPTIVVDSLGIALGLAYSNESSLRYAITHRCGTYWSRSRQGLWIKGASSGATQKLRGVRLDCDRDCLRFQVDQHAPGFCHLENHTCFGEERNIVAVMRRLQRRIQSSDEKSFTRKLANDRAMLKAKLLEEAEELAEAETKSEVAFEAADVLYFSLVRMLNEEVPLEDVYQELARRMNRVVRRKNKLEHQPDTQT